MLLKIERTIMQKTSSRKGNEISLSEIGKYYGEDVYQAFLALKEKGYFSMVDSDISRNSFSYVLTPQGRFYKEYSTKKFIANILIPIAVSLITTIGALYLEKLAENNNTEYTSENTCNYSDTDF